MLQHIRCCQEAVTCVNVTPSLLKLQLFTHSKSYSEQGFRARIVESTSIWGIAEDWMGHVFLVHMFKNSWQQSAKKAENKLSYDLTDNLMARELLATNPSPFQRERRVNRGAFRPPLPLLGTAAVLRVERDGVFFRATSPLNQQHHRSVEPRAALSVLRLCNIAASNILRRLDQ